MATVDSAQGDRERRLDEAIAQYLQLQAAGQAPEREAWVAQFPDLADELREFLADASRVQAMLHPAVDATRDLPAHASQVAHSAAAGMCVAERFWLEKKLGEGGMGEVWAARQVEPVKRRVALKLIKVGMDSRAVLARFEAERQALALMDHPNIAKVLDGGLTREGHPFFVMELVNGAPLTTFCDEARMTPTQRLELFVQVCQGVQHAHQKGIVHRDLKPSNILVTLYDGKPVPKIIDFGVAKAISGQLGDESLLTGFGAVVGTLEYMSPEQAGLSGLDVDTRADIYSLGVILYELLTGLRPIDAHRLAQAAFTEMIRLIREEEPPRPSTRLSTNESLPSLAAVRQVEPRRLMALLRGELDWVVMKCLEKDRNRRYATANGLAMDLRRYLAGEPVEARPTSTSYRLGKFVRRHRASVAGVSLLLLTLVGGIVATSMALVRARRAERLATTQGVRAAVVRDFLIQDLLGQASPELNPRSDQVTVEQLLDRAATRLQDNSRMADAPEARAEVLAVLGETYDALGQYGKAADHWQRALELNQQLNDKESKARALDAQQGYGSALIGTDRLAEAEKILREVVERRRSTSGSEDTKTLFAINNLGHVLYRQGRFSEAEPLARENLQTRLRVFGKENRDTLQAIANYASMLMKMGDYEQAETMFREAVDGIRKQGRGDSPSALEWENGLATTLIHQRKLEEARKLLTEMVERMQRVLGPTHTSTMGSRTNLAYVLGELGDFDAAVQESTAVYEGLRAEYGETYSETLTALNSLVLALCSAHRWDEAERHARVLVEAERGRAEPNQTDLMTFTMNLGWACEGQQKLDEAEKWFRESLTIAQVAGHAEDPTGLDAAHNLTRVLFRQKRFEESLDLGRKTLAARRRIQSPNTLVSARAVIETLVQLERFEEAERELRGLLSTGGRPWPDDVQAVLCVQLGQLCLRERHYREAIEPLQRALAIREQRFAGQWQVSEVRSLLGEALTGTGDFDLAEEALQAAINELDAAPAAASNEAAAIRDATNRRLGELSRARKEAVDAPPARSEDQAK